MSVGEAVILLATVRDGCAVRAGQALTLAALVADGPAEVMIRSEQLAILASGAGGGVAARVLDVSYFGHDALVRSSYRTARS